MAKHDSNIGVIGGILLYVLLGLGIFILILSVLTNGLPMLERLDDLLASIVPILFIVNLIIFFPLTYIKKIYEVCVYIVFLSSYIFGFALWLHSLLITLNFWGVFGVILGTLAAGLGVVFTAFVSSLLNGAWDLIGDVLFLSIATFGIRALAVYRAQKMEI